MDEKAGATLEVEIVGHPTPMAWIRKLFLAVPDPPQYDIKVKIRSSGKIVYSVRGDAGVAANAAMSEIEEDLETLTTDEFCKKHGFPAPH